jgi:hypothetical protein
MTAAVTSTIMTTRPRKTKSLSSPVAIRWYELTTADGSRTTMPAKMMREMPLPMPRSEICSPSHMIRAVPVVRVSMVMRRKPQPGTGTSERPPWGCMLSRPTAMPKDWMSDSTMVP